ncbi:MAG: (2Fe-2S)-binding protein [Proteobacteria bacterium]|nr:(2Fe-2S)-binding protein [Pseudomonadota bacterium]
MPALSVNGHPLDFRLDGGTPLVVALREAANLTGTKLACGTGDCGACMVLVDGEAMAACQITLAEAEGRSVTTIEGLSADRSHPVQAALIAEQAGQCGFCIPGMAIRMAALLAHNPSPGDAEIRAALTNLCRCGAYPRLLRAVHRAAATLRPPAPPAPPPAATPVKEPAQP